MRLAAIVLNILKLAPVLVACFVFGCSRSESLGLRLFVRAGEKSDGSAWHDFARFLNDWKKLLSERGAHVQGGTKFPTKAQLGKTDVLILYTAEDDRLSATDRSNLERFVQAGGGWVMLHDAIRSADQDWLKGIAGGSWDAAASRTREGLMGLYFQDHQHPISEGVSNFDLDDELAYQLQLAPEAKVIATSFQTAKELAPQIWSYEREGHRAVVFLPGHKYNTFSLPHVRALLLRSIGWAARQDVELL